MVIIQILHFKESSDKRYIGFKGNNDLSKYHLKNIKQNYSSEVESIKFNNFFWEIRLKNEKILQAQSIIFTCPFPQLKDQQINILIKECLNCLLRWSLI